MPAPTAGAACPISSRCGPMPVNSEARSPDPNWRRRRRTTARRRASQLSPEMWTIEEKSRVVSVTLWRRRVIGPNAECPSVL